MFLSVYTVVIVVVLKQKSSYSIPILSYVTFLGQSEAEIFLDLGDHFFGSLAIIVDGERGDVS